MISRTILVLFLALSTAATDTAGTPKGQAKRRDTVSTSRRLQDGKGKGGKGSSFCGKAGKGKGNPPSLDPVCIEDDGAICTGCGPIVTSISLESEVNIAAGTMFGGSVIGGISAITYDTDLGVYYLLSDDMAGGSQRFYVADIDTATGSVEITDVRHFRRAQGSFAEGDLDPEGFAYKSPGTLIMASERSPPAIFEFDLAGTLLRYFLVPTYYCPNSDGSFGVRTNLGFEGLSLSPSQSDVWAANEAALAQDGPAASLTEASPARITKFDYETGVPDEEYVYYVDPVAEAPVPDGGFTVSGITEIISLDDCGQMFLALERSFSAGVGNTCKLYEFSTCNATDQSGMETIIGASTGTFSVPFPESETVEKTLLADFSADFGITPDNCEGMQLMTDDSGAKTLIVVSDDNFDDSQTTQFLFFSLEGNFA